ncbi:MAG: hypothetical protein AB7U79_06080 [Candidatus Izemoplasmatales bacterium]
MKKLLLSTFLLLVLGSFTACQDNNINLGLGSVNDIFAFEAVAATELLNESISNSITDNTVYISSSSVSPTSMLSSDVDLIQRYLFTVQQFLKNDYTLDTALYPSDNSQFQNRVQFTLSSLDGIDTVYNLYLTQTNYDVSSNSVTTSTSTKSTSTTTTTTSASNSTTSTTTSTVPNTTTTIDTTAGATKYANDFTVSLENDSFSFPDTFDSAVFYSFSGMFVINSTITYLEGKQLNDGTEDVFILRAYTDNSNYVSVRYNTDTDGLKKYFFETVVNGVTVNTSNVSITSSGDILSATLGYVEGNQYGTYTFTLDTSKTNPEVNVLYDITNGLNEEEQGNLLIIISQNQTSGEISYEYYITVADSQQIGDNSTSDVVDPTDEVVNPDGTSDDVPSDDQTNDDDQEETSDDENEDDEDEDEDDEDDHHYHDDDDDEDESEEDD